MKQVLVTGGSGKAGRATIKELQEHGYSVVSVDQARPAEQLCPFTAVDLTDFGQTLEALSAIDDRYAGVDAVVHLAAIPAPGLYPNAHTFQNNIVSTYNVFEAARRLGIKNVVWASSETVLGLPFDAPPPYAPLDEEYTGRPETAYSLSKFLGEEMAKQFCRWDAELKIAGLRFSNIMEPHDYERFGSFQDDAKLRKWNLWGYIDVRDAAQAVRKALEADFKGAEIFIIANNETVMDRSNAELMAEIYPSVSLKEGVGPNETLLSNAKAKQMLGFEPHYSWKKPN
jgi:nucleoside-diphosphate-sugar epimerase